jgi:hypothetical protein
LAARGESDRAALQALEMSLKFIAFCSPFVRDLDYAGFATQEVAKWTFNRN